MLKCGRREFPEFLNHTLTINCTNLIQNDMASTALKPA